MAFGIYNLGPPIGAAIGIAFGASIAAAFVWRWAFIAIGAVGIVTAILVKLLIREPVRGGLDPSGAVTGRAPFWGTMGMFFTHPVLMLAALGSGATQFVTYGLGNFAVLFLMREKGMSLGDVAIWYALVVGLGMGAGMIISGKVIDHFTKVSRTVYAIAPAISLAVALPFFLGFVWAPGWPLALVLLTVAMLFNYVYLSCSVALVQEEVRPDQRVLSGALLLLVMNFHRSRARPDLGGCGKRLVHRARHPAWPAAGSLYAGALLPRRDRTVSAARTPRSEDCMKTIHALLALTSSLAAIPAAAQEVIDTPAGRLSGSTDGAIRVFKGIPYALPPVAERRWKPPVAMPRWQDVRRATNFGPACVQPTPRAPSVYSPTTPLPTSEDCLSLNVWTPANTAKAPVLVWIHGGALLTLSREDLYDGRRLAERGVVVVSINYRLGALGWMAHPGLGAENLTKLSGNYGLLDQVQALRWVRDNIAAFGGDPANVTIAGESAGALSVTYLMTAPPARGLFARAIAQSAYMVTAPELKRSAYGLPSGEAAGQAVAAALKAPDIAALRAMNAQTLTDGAAAAGFQPWGLIDGVTLPEQLVDAFDAGRQARVPILAGFNQGEIRSLRILAPPAPADASAYEAAIRARYGDLSAAFLALYPAATYRESILATTRDALYGWTSERLARRQAERGQASYLYLFDHGYPAMDEAGLHAFHASELPYTFGTLNRTGPLWPRIPDTRRETTLSDAMIGYWTSFAATGVPQAPGAPAWPQFRDGRTVMHFAAAPRTTPRLLGAMFDLNEEVVRRRRAAKVAWNWNVGLAAPLCCARDPRQIQ